ncbi:MAG TPA: hypothetical protein VFB15_07510 [Candidatus Binataceae bacterium]|jgi:hypothetical protein|nr:hypothetical protein [Candidatus Binataceae bacterium]
MRPDSILPVRLTAVLSRLRIPARILAEFGDADRLEVDFTPGAADAVTFKVGDNVVATATLEEDQDRLIARITRLGDHFSRRFDQWQIRKNAQTMD